MEFQTLGKKERQLLLVALGFDIRHLNCSYCGDSVSYENCGIMPPIDKKHQAMIICPNSILCMSEYLRDIEKEKEES